MIYFSYVHSIILYGIILGGNSSHSKIIFKIQIKIIGVITGFSSRESCFVSCSKIWKSCLSNLRIYFLYHCLLFKNKELLTSNSYVHNIIQDIILTIHLHIPNLTVFQKGVRVVIRDFNKLPLTIKDLSCGVKQFKLALKRFLLANSFYCLEECFDWR